MNSEKKSIIFLLEHMQIGGAEEALINLIERIDKERYEVYLFTQRLNNPHLNRISGLATLLFKEDYLPKRLFINDLLSLKLLKVARNVWYRFCYRFETNPAKKEMWGAKGSFISEKEYDLAISYGMTYVFNTLYRFPARKKIAFIHSEIIRHRYINNVYFAQSLNKFDKVFCVSQAIKEQTDEVLPSISDKTAVFYNIINEDRIIQNSQHAISDEHWEEGNIVSVGRLSPPKGFSLVPETIKNLLSLGYNLKWYIVGEGEERARIEKLIRENKVESNVFLLGEKSNPYPYIKGCGIYVQPSISEAWCLTVTEAKILKKPIVATALPAIQEQISNGKNGILVDPSIEGLVNGIKMIIENNSLRETFKTELGKELFCTNTQMKMIYKFLNKSIVAG